MSGRAYAQIRWYQERFGLMLVNSGFERFFLLADKLRDLYEFQGSPRVVKLRDRKPARAVGYYPGQVIGILDLDGDEAVVRLYIGEPYRDMELGVDGEPETYLTAQRYVYPLKEFQRFKRTLDIMMEQERQVADLLRSAEMTPMVQKEKRGK